MKPSNAIRLILAFFLCALAVIAEPDTRLVGTWSQEGGQEATWTFRPDGSGFMEQNNPRSTARFTWSCRGVRLQVSTGSLSVPYTIVANDSNSLVLRNDQVATTYKLRRKG